MRPGHATAHTADKMAYTADEIEEEIRAEGEDDLKHLGEHWAEEAQALSSRQLSEALKICQSLRSQLSEQCISTSK